MPNAVAFFPWLRLDEPRHYESVRLIPYIRGQAPVNCPHVEAQELDKITAAYAERKDLAITHAVLLEVDEWCQGTEVAPEQRTRLFFVRELLAFSAIAARRLFVGHGDYCNYDHFEFVVQNYAAGSAGTFSFHTRRRDGGTRHLWSTDDYAFYRPRHAPSERRFPLDESLLNDLLGLGDNLGPAENAIVEFNQANTDGGYGPQHHEVVLMKSAFEFLFQIGQHADEFVDALLDRCMMDFVPGAELSNGYERWVAKGKCRSKRSLEGWAREFCLLRNESAHGRRRRGPPVFLWGIEAHLAFASILFPLVLKRDIARRGGGELALKDQIALRKIEAYLCSDPFASTETGTIPAEEHPWVAVYSDVILDEVIRQRLVKANSEVVRK